MSYRAKAMALAKQLGAIVEVNQEGRTYTIQAAVPLPAPDGRHMVWAATGTHEMVESIYKGPWGTEELWKDVLESMQHGLTPCEDPNCEWFLEEPEDESNPFEQPEPPDDQYDPVELAKGTKVELEHTQDRRIAKRIAKDHLDETKSYYRKLATLGLNPDIRSNPEAVVEVDGQQHALKPMAAFYGWPGKVWTRMVTQDPYTWQAGALVLFYGELREAYVSSDISASDARRQVIRRMLGDLK